MKCKGAVIITHLLREVQSNDAFSSQADNIDVCVEYLGVGDEASR